MIIYPISSGSQNEGPNGKMPRKHQSEPLSQLIWSMSNTLGWLGRRQLEILRRAETGAETALNKLMISTGHLGQI
ncbi:MAG: hypothetical protein HOD69_16450 [Marinovum sp.]|nr:hypothetical protein [Marinovum sp.]